MPRSPEPQLAARLASVPDDIPSSDSEDDDGGGGEEVYEVEAIRASRYDEAAGAMRYCVKWKGYGEDEKTWEPIENLQNCSEMVKAFEIHQADIKRKLAERQAESQANKRDKAQAKKASARPSSLDSGSDDNGVSLKELDARREKAKKVRASAPRSSVSRAESDVAAKWEKEAVKKARQSEPTPSTSKAKPANRSPTKKRAAQEEPPAAKKPKKAPKVVVSSDSSTDDDLPADQLLRKPAAPMTNGAAPFAPGPPPEAVESQVDVAATPVDTSSTPIAQSSAAVSLTAPTASRALAEPAIAKPQPRPLQGPYATINAMKGISFKKAPIVAPPAPPGPVRAHSPAQISPIHGHHSGSRVRFASGPEGPAPPRSIGVAQPAGSALRQGSLQPAIRGGTPQPAVPRPQTVAEQSEPAPPAGAAAAPEEMKKDGQRAGSVAAEGAIQPTPTPEEEQEQERQLELQRVKRLGEMEGRLRRTAWCIADPRFEKEALPVACAEAIPIDAPLVRRLKKKGVAVLFSTRQDAMAGEGLALGYLLMSMGAITPDRLEAVEAVFLHRNDSFAQLESLYAELVNLTTHAVEFFRFGGGQPVEDIFRAGYLVVPTLSALQRGASYERFCENVRDVYDRTCQMYVHPATIAYLRSLNNWNTLVDRLSTTGVEIIDRDELPLTSAFAGIEKSALVAPASSWSATIPQVDAATEFNEVLAHIAHTRFKYPATWRRFIVVVNELRDEEVDLARKKGIELKTWESLTDLVKAHPFG